jgi:hypothetical protein
MRMPLAYCGAASRSASRYKQLLNLEPSSMLPESTLNLTSSKSLRLCTASDVYSPNLKRQQVKRAVSTISFKVILLKHLFILPNSAKIVLKPASAATLIAPVRDVSSMGKMNVSMLL